MNNNRADVARAIRAANGLLSPFAISEPSQIDLEAIARSRDVLVYDSDLNGAEARLIRHHRNAGIIRIRPNIKEIGRRRFTLAHELGHWELHAEYSQSNVCSESDIADYRNSKLEIEANFFASELLMPTDLFRMRCESDEPDVLRIREIAEEFRVSQTAAAIRFVEECRNFCIVIFSEGGTVGWWWDRFERRNGQGRRLWVPRQHKLQRGTGAWTCAQGEKSSGSMVEVDPALWLPDLPNSRCRSSCEVPPVRYLL